MPHGEEGSKTEVLSNQPSMVVKTAQEKKFKTVNRILALLTVHGKNGQGAMPHVEEGSKTELLSNQPSMVESSVQDLKLKTVIQILVLLTAPGGSGQSALPHVEKRISLDLSKIKHVMVEMLAWEKVHNTAIGYHVQILAVWILASYQELRVSTY